MTPRQALGHAIYPALLWDGQKNVGAQLVVHQCVQSISWAIPIQQSPQYTAENIMNQQDDEEQLNTNRGFCNKCLCIVSVRQVNWSGGAK